MSKKKNVATNIDRHINPQAILSTGAYHFLELANKTKEGSYYAALASILLSAFTLEAFLNFLGNRCMDNWEEIERKNSPEEKLKLLTSKIQYKVDYGHRPFQTFRDIFWLRNGIVHPKEEILTDDQVEYDGDYPPILESKVFDEITIKTAKRFYDDTKEIQELLTDKAGIPQHEVFLPGSSTAWISNYKEDDDI